MSEKEPSNSRIIAALLGGDDWEWRHFPSYQKHMQALGVIAANYNDLEVQFSRLFYITSDKFEVAKLIFSKLNNAERIEVALKVSENEPSQFRPLLQHFIAGFSVSNQNRNDLMHSKAHNAWSFKPENPSVLTLAKQLKKKPDENHFVSLSVDDLRGVADDMSKFSNFGWDVFLWRLAFITGGTIDWGDGKKTTPTLPEKPPEPRRLILEPQEAPTTESPQPQSSGE